MPVPGDLVHTGGTRMATWGVITMLLGVFAVFTPMLTGFSILLLLGVLVMAAGVMRMLWAFKAGSVGRGLLMFVLGLLTLAVGSLLLVNPLFAAVSVTILLTAYLVVDGAAELYAGIQRRPDAGWGWLTVGGVVSILLGILIWRQAPLAGVWAIGLFLGIKLFFVGLMMMTVGGTLRGIAKG
jgi:uncharacterized membrane protein HdeD (DUF308 family)